MRARFGLLISAVAPLFGAGVLTVALPAAPALAGGCCTPPPCCRPPTPPPPPCNCGGHQVNIPGVNVNVGANVMVNVNAQTTVTAGASAQGGAVVFGGGGSNWSVEQGSLGLIQSLNVEGRMSRTAYEATRTRIKIVVIRAVCIDDQEIPHPASQTSPDREIAEAFEGELFRCIAGTHMQATISDYDGHVDFDHGQTMNCNKGDALYRAPSGELVCRPQKPARDCNERSLLRRFGAGIKIVKIVTTERYTAYREESESASATASVNMTIDGGVGGIVR